MFGCCHLEGVHYRNSVMYHVFNIDCHCYISFSDFVWYIVRLEKWRWKTDECFFVSNLEVRVHSFCQYVSSFFLLGLTQNDKL